MPQTNPQNPPTALEQRLDTRHCVICTYPLRGLAPTTTCPECGTPIQRSLRGDRLADANPRWLTWILAAVLGLLVSGLLNLIIQLPPIRRSMPAMSRFGITALWTAWALGFSGFLFGIFALTAKEPAASAKLDPRRTRHCMRAAVTTIALIVVISMTMRFAITRRPSQPVVIFYYVLMVLGDLLSLIVSIGMLLILRRLMIRAHAPARRIILTVMIVLSLLTCLPGDTAMHLIILLQTLGIDWYFQLRSTWPDAFLLGQWIDSIGSLIVLLALAATLPTLHHARRAART